MNAATAVQANFVAGLAVPMLSRLQPRGQRQHRAARRQIDVRHPDCAGGIGISANWTPFWSWNAITGGGVSTARSSPGGEHILRRDNGTKSSPPFPPRGLLGETPTSRWSSACFGTSFNYGLDNFAYLASGFNLLATAARGPCSSSRTTWRRRPRRPPRSRAVSTRSDVGRRAAEWYFYSPTLEQPGRVHQRGVLHCPGISGFRWRDTARAGADPSARRGLLVETFHGGEPVASRPPLDREPHPCR